MADHTEEQVVVESQYYSLLKEPANHLAILLFHSETTPDAFRKSMHLLLEQSKKYSISNWLIFCGKRCCFTTDDIHWTEDEVVPRVVKELELQRIAIVESPEHVDRFNLMALFDALSSISETDIQFFEKEKNARTWLREDSNLNF
ncbi:hypothetical protein [Pontibacter sp. H249]|uniref:hypothetical protein n=1 Tax=Pontibacter sp. H249 TaxID=3133420 RepID=UPI0030BDDCE6